MKLVGWETEDYKIELRPRMLGDFVGNTYYGEPNQWMLGLVAERGGQRFGQIITTNTEHLRLKNRDRIKNHIEKLWQNRFTHTIQSQLDELNN